MRISSGLGWRLPHWQRGWHLELVGFLVRTRRADAAWRLFSDALGPDCAACHCGCVNRLRLFFDPGHACSLCSPAQGRALQACSGVVRGLYSAVRHDPYLRDLDDLAAGVLPRRGGEDHHGGGLGAHRYCVDTAGSQVAVHAQQYRAGGHQPAAGEGNSAPRRRRATAARHHSPTHEIQRRVGAVRLHCLPRLAGTAADHRLVFQFAGQALFRSPGRGRTGVSDLYPGWRDRHAGAH